MLPLYDNIRRRRIELGLSQQELAERSGYTDRSSIAKIEAGKVDLTQSKILAIAKALNISPGTLMGWTLPQNKALWQYLTIKGDKLVLQLPGLSDCENECETSAEDYALSFDISPDIIPIPNTSQRTVFAMEGDRTETAFVREDNYEELSDLMTLLRDMPPEKLKKIAEFVEMMK